MENQGDNINGVKEEEDNANSPSENDNNFSSEQGDDDGDDSPPPRGMKGDKPPQKRAGRRKINIEFIKDKSRRHITFSKRKAGIMKKAYELSTLTGTQVLLLVASETGHVYTFATPKLQPLITKTEGKNLIQACLNAPDPQLLEGQDSQGGGDMGQGDSQGMGGYGQEMMEEQGKKMRGDMKVLPVSYSQNPSMLMNQGPPPSPQYGNPHQQQLPPLPIPQSHQYSPSIDQGYGGGGGMSQDSFGGQGNFALNLSRMGGGPNMGGGGQYGGQGYMPNVGGGLDSNIAHKVIYNQNQMRNSQNPGNIDHSY